ncbi:MAG: ribosome-associated ATPase/putative transporter RbbA [Oceanospirillaceae bacterium]|nr:ribosome-associated ATPase/putative transporter RbbA [Oceanospirillaceae bacterium]MCP5334138.1 ribosome-associated ATPase/putative transporter RbbA [Oceanospirillaceae bacterium]
MSVIAQARGLQHSYAQKSVLGPLDIAIPAGVMAGFIGPDGVGKSTLLALITGVRELQQGELQVLNGDMRNTQHRRACLPRIAYMPQGLGRNLYPTLSVRENLDFFARLFAQHKTEREQRIEQLTRATGLWPFLERPAGKLSGGMKQKLSLCCALIHDPDLLVLDEPTTGVDPLSRQQFWTLINDIRRERPHMSVLVATAYMEEAEQFDWLAAMDAGQIIACGSPAELKQKTGADHLEAAFISLLPQARRANHKAVVVPPRQTISGPLAIEAEHLTQQFGDFIAVNDVSFSIEKGEIFGFLGSNGCGKTTTMKMLTGLLAATSGTAKLFGQVPDADDMATRQKVGYMSQSFSLYSELSVLQNLSLHARLYKLPEKQSSERIAQMLDEFDLRHVQHIKPDNLPLGIRQRLQLAVALIHKPEILILDEPTSGVDPVARDQFWQHLVDLSRNQGVTIFISTHFMNEAQRCDRISLMHAGRVLAVGKPAELAARKNTSSLEEAFVDYLREAAGLQDLHSHTHEEAPAQNDKPQRDNSQASNGHKSADTHKHNKGQRFNLRRLWAYTWRESLELKRDKIRLAFALLGPVVLMLTFGFGISFDVNELAYAVYDRDQSPQSRQVLEGFEGSRYFSYAGPVVSHNAGLQALQDGKITLLAEIPPDFGRDLMLGKHPSFSVLLDGAMPFRAETAGGYVNGMLLNFSQDLQRNSPAATQNLPLSIQSRFHFNQAFKSVYAIVPGVIMLMLALIPAMMTAVGIVREKESGSIANFHSTPVTRLEFLLGKQIPYVVVACLSYVSLLLMALLIFQVPLKGSLAALSLGALVYVMATTGFGMLVSTFTKTQVAAIFAAAILTMLPTANFSGLLVPTSSLSGVGQWLGLFFPASWFQQISIGSFTKALGFAELWPSFAALALFILAFTLLSVLGLKKQEA